MVRTFSTKYLFEASLLKLPEIIIFRSIFYFRKACLGILGIPFIDVVRVLSAVLLLGNISFVDSQSLEVEIRGESELNSIASLLGVSSQALFR
jgi:hypothetical protein